MRGGAGRREEHPAQSLVLAASSHYLSLFGLQQTATSVPQSVCDDKSGSCSGSAMESLQRSSVRECQVTFGPLPALAPSPTDITNLTLTICPRHSSPSTIRPSLALRPRLTKTPASAMCRPAVPDLTHLRRCRLAPAAVQGGDDVPPHIYGSTTLTAVGESPTHAAPRRATPR